MNICKRFIKNLTDVLTGRRILPDVNKYRFICYALAFVHIAITVRFYSLHYTILYVYNFLSVIFYLIIGTILPKKGKFYTAYLCCFVEILIHSPLATLLAGWEWGYMIYILALIPVAFYLSYSTVQFGRNAAKPFVFTFIAMCVFILTRILSVYIDPIYTWRVYDKNLTIAYNLNSALAFFMLIFFSVLFTIEIRRNEMRLESQNRILSDVSSKDPLTGLLNRRSIDVHLKEAVEHFKSKGEIFSVVIGDIDDFKMVNDTYGHNVGDDILVNVADIICSNIPEDAKVCRWGGEEILILIHGSVQTAAPIAENIRKAISKSRTKAGDALIGVTMTFGMAEYQSGYAMTKLISVADKNLYKGKNEGKNRVIT